MTGNSEAWLRLSTLEYSTVSLLMFALGCGWMLRGGGVGAESAAGLSPPVPLCLLPGCPGGGSGGTHQQPHSCDSFCTSLGQQAWPSPKWKLALHHMGASSLCPTPSSHEMFSHFFFWNVT